MAHQGTHFNYKKDTQQAWLYCITTLLTLLFTNTTTYLALRYYHPAIRKASTLGLAVFFMLNTTKSLLPGIPVTVSLFLLLNLHKRFVALNLFLR